MVPKDTLHFPEILLLRFLEADTSNPIPKIAVTLTVYARTKNDYHLGPPLSSQNGEIKIAYNWVMEAIQYISNTALMDYATPMDQCFSEISIKVMSDDEISRAISAMKLYGIEEGSPEIAHTIFELQHTNNEAYEPIETKVTLNNPKEVTRSIEIKLRKVNS